MNPSESLAKRAGEDKLIRDDTEAAALLISLGIFDKLAEAKADKSSLSIPRIAAISHADHATHYILAVLFYGNSKPADDGYVVFCWAKSSHTFNEVNGHIGDFFRMQNVVLSDVHKVWLKNDSPNN